VILDGTLLPIDRVAADRPCYFDKHENPWSPDTGVVPGA
jgi:hypothetical protein